MPFALPTSPVFWLSLVCLGVQLWYWGYYFWPFATRPPEVPAAGPAEQPVSVIVCARNELDNLRELLPLLLKQDYPAALEVVLIDDRSRDDIQLYAQQLAQYYPGRFRLVTVDRTPESFAPKKYALTLGIKAARHDQLLFTDADCRPATDQWVRRMQSGFGANGGADIVLGFSGATAAPGFLNQLVRYETLLTAAQYLGFAGRGRPYMGVGRNLAYTRATFQSTKGFASHIRRLSGDDDLLVQDALRQGARVAVRADAPAHTHTAPPATWAAWWRQKRRHLSAGPRYRFTDRLRIGVFLMANVLFYLAPLGLLAAPAAVAKNFVPLIAVWAVRTFALCASYARVGRRLHQPQPLALLPVLDAVYFFNYLALGISLLIKRTLRWK